MTEKTKPPKLHDKNTAVEQMTTWFHSNFENPAESAPYESAEGGYQYIWGGPYDAREELDAAFGDQLTALVGAEAADDLLTFATSALEEDGNTEWGGIPREEEDA
jgi:hypothetical protein